MSDREDLRLRLEGGEEERGEGKAGREVGEARLKKDDD
jgi:hypothetical protein